MLALNIGKPTENEWPRNFKDNREILGDWLIRGCYKPPCSSTKHEETESEGYDGFYNNLAHPDLGAIGIYKHIWGRP